MTAQTRRHLELLDLARPLRRYAGCLGADDNAAHLLVHMALMSAFRQPDGLLGAPLEVSLRRDIDRGFAAGA